MGFLTGAPSSAWNKLLNLFQPILLAPDSSEFGLGPVRQSQERDVSVGGGGIRHPKG